MAGRRNAREVFNLYLGTLSAHCYIFPGCWTKPELESQHDCSLSPVAGICTRVLKGTPMQWVTCMGLNVKAKCKNLFFLCELYFHSYLNYFFHAVDGFGYCCHQLNMPVMKVASAGSQSNCFDRPWDVQRKHSSIFSFLMVRQKHLCEDCTAQRNSSV